MPAKCIVGVLELNGINGLEKIENLSSCAPVIQLQNGSFRVVERTRTGAKCTKVKIIRAKRAKLPFCIVKYANL